MVIFYLVDLWGIWVRLFYSFEGGDTQINSMSSGDGEVFVSYRKCL
jgi:hypothetical protein